MFVCSIIIENVDEKCTKAELEAAFRPFGEITLLNYRVKGHALLKYTVPDAARLAIQRMNLVPLCGSCLCVSISDCCIFCVAATVAVIVAMMITACVSRVLAALLQ